MNNTFYSLSARSLKNDEVSFDRYRDKVILVVNTASKCGFTPQFEGLQKLYEKFHDRGLEILGFPCNQFANQEPGDAASIQGGCLLNYGVTFPMFEKTDVNGRNEHPVYSWLKNSFPGWGPKRIRWNFTKFLIDRNGNPVRRFAPTKRPEDLEPVIAGLL